MTLQLDKNKRPAGDSLFDGTRSLYDAYGYNNKILCEDYFAKYYRQDIAKRIVDAFPEAIWTDLEGIKGHKDDADEDILNILFHKLNRKINIYTHLNSVDKLSRIGRYAVLLIGVADGLPLNKPIGKLKDWNSIAYLTPFSELNSDISSWESDRNNPRYGLPTLYTLTTGGATSRVNQANSTSSVPRTSLQVHHSRVLHVADQSLDNPVLGTPVLQSVYNRLIDLEKVVGSSAETFYLNARGGIHVDVDGQYDAGEVKDLNEQTDAYVRKLDRVLLTRGTNINPIIFPVADPQEHVEKLLDLISGATGIPKRILIGSERGELASSQDQNNWNSRVIERRENYCEPFIVRRLVDKFMELGALPQTENYDVLWVDKNTETNLEKAEMGLKKAQALVAYASTLGADQIIPPKQFVEEVLGMEYQEGKLEEIEKEADGDIIPDDNINGSSDIL